MKGLKIMSEEMAIPIDPFGMNDLQDRLKAFCRDQGLDVPQFWIIKLDGYYMGYAVSMLLSGKDRCEEFDANVIFLLKDFSERDNREVEKRLLEHMTEEFGEPVVLTSKTIQSPNGQQRFLKGIGFSKMPVTWSDNLQNTYEVYAKGCLEMGGFVNLMERVEYIGKEFVYR